MLRSSTVRIAALYLPLVTAALAGLIRRRRPRQFAACLLSFLWVLSTLLVFQHLNQSATVAHLSANLTGVHTALMAGRRQIFTDNSWWSYAPSPVALLTIPIELYLGWAILWGLVPQLAFHRLDPPEVVVLMGAFDLWMMPFCSPVVRLEPNWLVGEAVVLFLVLLPALYIARWTLNDTHLNLRTTMQVLLSGLTFLFLLPEIVFALRAGRGWSPLLQMPGWQRQLGIQLLLLLAIPGVSAVMEFAQRGNGTPIPYDPPKRLVTSGIYRYCTNPMQLSCALVMLLWAAMLHNPWLVLAAAMSSLYSAGIAGWDERQDLDTCFGQDWRRYRSAVPSWRFRLLPYHSGVQARLYIARTCGPCSELRAWLTKRHPLGLEFIDAETLPAGSIRRLRYDPADGTPAVDGVRVLARALEHLHFGWAYCGAVLRLPIVWQFTQLLMDASGLGPRLLGEAGVEECGVCR